MDISGKDIIDSSLTLLEFYRFDQFFEKYLEKLNLTKKEFYKDYFYNYNKNPNSREDFLKAKKIKNDALVEYKQNYPNDYKLELEYQTKKYEIENKKMIDKQTELLNIKIEEQIQVIMRQTTYTYDEAKEELKRYNYNTFDVIRNFISGEKSNSKKEDNKIKTSTNQEIYSQIRSYLGFVPLQ